jgi:thiamine biosynthesis protein ThiS
MISVHVSYQGKGNKVSVKDNSEVGEVLEKAGINKETVIVRRSEEIIPDNEKLNDKDKLEVLRIISGG